MGGTSQNAAFSAQIGGGLGRCFGLPNVHFMQREITSNSQTTECSDTAAPALAQKRLKIKDVHITPPQINLQTMVKNTEDVFQQKDPKNRSQK